MKILTPPHSHQVNLINMGLLMLFLYSIFQPIHAQQWVPFNAMDAEEPVCTVLNSDTDSVVFNVQIPGMYEEYVDSLQRISIQGFGKTDSTGCPELPALDYLVAIPDCDSVNLEFVLNDSIIFSNRYIYPVPEMVPYTLTAGAIALVEQFTYVSTAYISDAMFPNIVRPS